MATPVPIKYYFVDEKSGENRYMALPAAGNVPYKEVSRDEYTRGLEQQLTEANNFLKTYVTADKVGKRGSGYYDPTTGQQFIGQGYTQDMVAKIQSKLNDVRNSLGVNAAGYDTGYRMDNGVLTTQQSIDQQAQYEAGVANGTLRKVPIGNGFGYVPTGSMADLNLNNPTLAQNIMRQLPAASPQITAPSQNLAPGDRGAEVEALQRYLVSMGFLSEQDMATGPGVYGPRTQAAVQKLQQAYNVDTSGGGSGSFGPLTRQALLNGSSKTGGAINVENTMGGTNGTVTAPTDNRNTKVNVANFSFSNLFGMGGDNSTGGMPDWVSSIMNEPSKTQNQDAYNSLYGQSGIDAKQEALIKEQKEYNTVKKELDGYQAELDAILLEEKQDELVAQDKPVSMGEIQRNTERLSRNAAVKALGVQAKAITAVARLNAEKGDVDLANQALEFAQQRLDTAFKIKSADIAATNDFAKEWRDRMWDVFTESQKQLVSKQEKIDSQNFQIVQNNLNYAQTLATAALNSNQGSLAQKLINLDPYSPTYNTQLATLAGQIKPKASTADKTGDYTKAGQFITDNSKATYDELFNGILQNTKLTGQEAKALLSSKGIEKGGLNDTKAAIVQAKNSGFTRDQVEQSIKDDNKVTEIPANISTILDDVYGKNAEQPQSDFKWWNPLTWF